MFVELLPATPRLNRHVPIFQIDLNNGIHLGHIDQHAVGRSGKVTTRVAHTATPGDDRCAALQTGTHQCLHFLNVAWPDNRTDRRPNRKHILRVQRYLLGICGDDLGR